MRVVSALLSLRMDSAQWSFVELLRAYVAAYPNVKSLKGMSVEKLQTGIKAAGKELPQRPNRGGAGHLPGGANGKKTLTPVVENEASDPQAEDRSKRVTLVTDNLMGEFSDVAK